MDMQAYIDEIKLRVTGGVLNCEIDDANLQKLVEGCLRELQRYIHTSRYVTIATNGSCIDVSKYKISQVHHVFVGDQSYGNVNMNGASTLYTADPLCMSLFNYASGNVSTMSDYINNYASWVYARQAMNAMGLTQLEYTFNKQDEKLYINSNVNCSKITIEYVPRFDHVDEITDDWWIDMLMRLCVATTKETLGLVRSKYTQNSGLWQLDGATMRQEGANERKELLDMLKNSAGDCRPSII